MQDEFEVIGSPNRAHENIGQQAIRLGLTGAERIAETGAGVIQGAGKTANLIRKNITPDFLGSTKRVFEKKGYGKEWEASPYGKVYNAEQKVEAAGGPQATRQIAEAIAGQPGYFEPQGFIEKGIVESIPRAVMLGISGPASLAAHGANTAGAFAGALAEEAGFGPIGSLAADLLGSGGFNKLSQMFKSNKFPEGWDKWSMGQQARYKKENNLPLSIREQRNLDVSQQYEKAREAAKPLKGEYNKIKETVEDVNSYLNKTSSVDEKDIRSIKKQADRLKQLYTSSKKSQVQGGSLNELWDIRKEIDSAAAKTYDKTTKNLWYQLRSSVNDSLQDAASKNPEFAAHFIPAELGYQASKFKSGITKALESDSAFAKAMNTSGGVAVSSLLGGLIGGVTGGVGSLAKGVAAPLATSYGASKVSQAADFIGFLQKDKAAQQLFKKAMIDFAKDAIPSGKDILMRLITRYNSVNSSPQDMISSSDEFEVI